MTGIADLYIRRWLMWIMQETSKCILDANRGRTIRHQKTSWGHPEIIPELTHGKRIPQIMSDGLLRLLRVLLSFMMTIDRILRNPFLHTHSTPSGRSILDGRTNQIIEALNPRSLGDKCIAKTKFPTRMFLLKNSMTSNYLLNFISPHAPVPVHPDERRWREPVQTAQSHWDTTREYPLDHPSHEGHPSGYYDYDRPYPEAEAYKTHTVYDDQPPHWSSRRSSPAQRGRSNSLRDHSRQRTMSVGHSPHVSDSSTPNWTRDRDIDVPRHSREGSFASPAPRITDRERPFTGSAPQRSSYSIPAPSPQSANPVRDTWGYSTDQSPVPRELQSESIPRSTRAFAPSPGIPDSLRKTGNVEERVPTDSRDFHARSNENFANSLPSPIKTAPTIQQPSSWNASYNQDSSAVHSIRNLPSETNLASKGVFQSSDSRGQDNTHGERQSEVGKHCIIFWYWNRLFKNYVFPIQRYELYY